MKLIFIKQIIKQDFNPISGGKTPLQHFFQCRLPVFGSMFILLLLCMTGMICLGIHGGVKKHFESLENDPFVSAIKINTRVYPEQLYQIAKHLFYDTQQNNFYIGECNENSISVIKGVYPFREIHFRFLKADGKTMTPVTHNVLSVKPESESKNTKQIDDKIEQWILKQLIKPDKYFQKEQSYHVDPGIIISHSFLKLLGYTMEQLPETISISYNGRYSIMTDRKKDITIPLTNEDKIKYVVELPLINVANKLPAGNAIMTEGFINTISKNVSSYDPCKPIQFIEIIGNNLPKTKITKWAIDTFDYFLDENVIFTQFDKTAIIKLADAPLNKDEHNRYLDTVAKCNIQIQFLKLQKEFPQLELNINQDLPMKVQGNKSYECAFLYINKHHQILERLEDLLKKLRKDYLLTVEDYQVMTLKKYRDDMRRHNLTIGMIFLIIGLIIFFYLIVSFTLFMQTKMHKIGTMLAMGATSKLLIMIYIIEALLMISIPIVLSSIICHTFHLYKPEQLLGYDISTVLFHYDIFWEIGFITITIITALTGAFIAACHVIYQKPYKLITYKN